MSSSGPLSSMSLRLMPIAVPLLLLISALLRAAPAAAHNPYTMKIVPGAQRVATRKFARIPDIYSKIEKAMIRPRIQATLAWRGNLYVVTSTSGGRVYRVALSGPRVVSLWFDVKAAMAMAARELDERNEQHSGLRSLAFHPDAGKRRFYVAVLEKHAGDMSRRRYLSRPRAGEDRADADSVLLEFRYNGATGAPQPWTLREVLRVGLPHYDHPVKQMVFHRKFLYIGHGDGSVQSAEVGGGQNDDALGKILRIDPLPKPWGRPYGVPGWNPFVRGGKYLPEVYAVGLRNPHNLCFSKRGELFVADSGRDNVEEINIVKRGGNYGWSKREGHFVHEERGGIGSGVSDLPRNDARNGFIYPNAVLGHDGAWGEGWIGFAVAGSCPIENGSPLDGLYLYANFAIEGQLYYSTLAEMRGAVTTGRPEKLEWATTFRAKIEYDHDRNAATPPKIFNELRDVTAFGTGRRDRADIRFGQGPAGEIYWTSKASGWVYLITNSVPATTRRRP